MPGRRHGDIGFYGAPRDNGWDNVAFTEHFYPRLFGQKPTLDTHARFIANVLPAKRAKLRRLQTPLLVGEFQANFEQVAGPRLTRKYFDVYAEYGWAATLWSLKGIKRHGGENRHGWFMLVNRAPLAVPNIRQAPLADIERFIRATGTMDYAIAEQLRQALTAPHPPPLALPSTGVN